MDDTASRAEKCVQKAKAHGVELKPGEAFIVVVEKLVERLDAYRDRPNSSGKILIE